MAIHTLKAVSRKLKEGMQVESTVRGFKMLLDEPKESGGTDKGMNPVEAVLCAFGSCMTLVATAFAQMHDINLEDFWVELEGDIDPEGVMGKAGTRPGLKEVRFKMHIKSNSPEDKVREFANFVENTCPVGDTLRNPVTLKKTDVIIEK